MGRGFWIVDCGLWIALRHRLERKSLGDLSSFVFRLSSLLALVFLSGCMLVSGERTAQDAQPAGGNVTTTFVSAEGSEERTFAIGGPSREVQVIGIVSVDSGDLTVELLAPDGSVAFAIGSRPGEAVTRSGDVALDDEGRLRYRIKATGARNGSFQLLYQELSGGSPQRRGGAEG